MLTVQSVTNIKMRSSKWVQYIILARPKEWAKNLFIFIPIFFAGKLSNVKELFTLGSGFIAFSLVASSIYIINDIRDLESDRKHPEKSRRPIAAGFVSKKNAWLLFGFLFVTGGMLAYSIGLKFLFVTSLYFLLNMAYSYGLKNISILDIFIISIGFVLRIKAGGVIAVIGISHWLMVMVFLLSLFMAIAKRRDDILIQLSSGKEIRRAIRGYNLEFLNVCLALLAAVIIVAYLMYTISPEIIQRLGTYKLYYTTIFVIAGLMRYLQLTYVENDSGSPTKILFKDRFLQVIIVLWLLSFYFLIYFPDIHIFDHAG